MRRLTCLLLLCGAFLTPALAQDDELGDDSPFLGEDKVTCQTPPMRVKRPDDAWQFVDLEKLAAQRGGRSDPSLKCHLWYGAARASIFVRAWVLPEGRQLPTAEALGEQTVQELSRILQSAEVKAKKKTKVGSQVGVLVEVQGQTTDRKGRTKTVTVVRAIAVRQQDRAVINFQLEFSDDKRAKDLNKAFKKVLKKAKL